MSNIDKVKLYPFSPLKLLHETRKLTASQAKFFVALICLYFEQYGDLEWYGGEGAEEKNAASYAPYCGVTKRTFIKMIDALQMAGVVYINDRGCITPVFAQEIQEAVNEGMSLRDNQDGTYEPINTAVAKKEEGVAAVADDMFHGEGSEIRDDARASNGGEVVDNVSLKQDQPFEEGVLTPYEMEIFTKNFPAEKDYKSFCSMPQEQKDHLMNNLRRMEAFSVETRIEQIYAAIETSKAEATREAKEKFEHEPFRQQYISEAIRNAVLEIAQYDRDEKVIKLVNNIKRDTARLTVEAFNRWAKTPAGKKYDEELAAAMAAQ